MKAPKDHYTIQIDITNACVHTCSNCTRSCMHQKKPFMMAYETFCNAVDSIIDHPGLIGVMGGEPTLHPQFKEMCQYLQDRLEEAKKPDAEDVVFPTNNLLKMRRVYEADKVVLHRYGDGLRPILNGAGLWTSLSKEYIKNMEIIQDTFSFQCLNDHVSASLHQPVLVARKDMGIADDEWFQMREKCWVNQTWSSSITPKGCFFCEIAAALDYMYDGPGGLPIEKGWWKRDISDFKEQFKWCELCGIPLKTFSRDARESITDVSETNYRLMQEHGLIRLDDEHLNVVKFIDGKICDSNDSSETYRGRMYIEEKNKVTANAPVYAGEFYGVIWGRKDEENEIRQSIETNNKWFSKLFVAYEEQGKANMTEILEAIGQNKYIILFTPKVILSDEVEKLKSCVINPGTLHCVDFSSKSFVNNRYFANKKELKSGFCLIFNTSASSISYLYESKNAVSVYDVINNWNPEKIVELSDVMNKYIFEDKKFDRKEIRKAHIKAYINNSGIATTLKYLSGKLLSRITERDKSFWK